MGLFGKLAGLVGAKSSRKASEALAPTDRPPFQPENELEELLVRAANDATERPAFLKALLNADLFAATPDMPNVEGVTTLEQDRKVSLLNVVSQDGSPIAAVFTAPSRAAECFGVVAYVGMNGRTLLDLVCPGGAVLNPASGYGVAWTADELAGILGRPVQKTIQRDTRVTLGEPKERPEALIAALEEALGQDPRVAEGWLALAHWPEEDAWRWYLDLRTGTPAGTVAPSLSEILRPSLSDGMAIDIIEKDLHEASGTGIRLKPKHLN